MGPDGRSVFEEGLYLPILPLARAGELNRDLIRLIRANVRTPDEAEGDILAYVTANETSARRLNAMLDEFGLDDIEKLAADVLTISENGMRAAIRALPDGTWRNEMRLDGFDNPVDLHVALTIAGDEIAIDFAGTSPASPRGINLVLNYTRAYASYGVRAAIAPDVPNNEGSLAPVRVGAPVGSRHIIGQFLPELVLGCLAEVLPDLVPAEGAACNWGLQLRGRAECRPFDILFFNAGGSGARPTRDGLSATSFPSGIRSIPVEICETAAPIVIARKELLPGSGGDGRYRGGLGQRIEATTSDGSPFQLFAVFDRVGNPARGRAGGEPGAPGRVSTFTGAPLRAKGQQAIAAGDGVRIDTPGGAGFGPPADRDPTLVAQDIEQGYVDE
jgi:5-oxoprolinase (ATP-hydrolysing)/N-methylhydantoinase A